MTERDFWFWLEGWLIYKNEPWVDDDYIQPYQKELILQKLLRVKTKMSDDLKKLKDFCQNKRNFDIQELCWNKLETYIKG